jgi:hypothetical protein
MKKLRKIDQRLINAAGYGDSLGVRSLLAAGADVHALNEGALRLASMYGHANVVLILIGAGADIYIGDNMPLRHAICGVGPSDSGNYARTVKVLIDEYRRRARRRARSRKDR